MNCIKWTPEEIALAIRLHSSGITYPEIEQRTGWKESTLRKLFIREGYNYRRRVASGHGSLGCYDGPPIPVTDEDEKFLDGVIAASANLLAAIQKAGLSA